jgi:Flp pilus assembly secretin CpaC
MARWLPTLIGFTWREVSGSVDLKSGKSKMIFGIWFPLVEAL